MVNEVYFVYRFDLISSWLGSLSEFDLFGSFGLVLSSMTQKVVANIRVIL